MFPYKRTSPPRTYLYRHCLLTLVTTLLTLPLHAQDLKERIAQYVTTYERVGMHINKPKFDACVLDDSARVLTVMCSGGFEEQCFDNATVQRIYADIRRLLPDTLADYRLQVVTDGHAIEQLIPIALRTNPNDPRSSAIDRSRVWPQAYEGEPWVRNISRPFTAEKGLEGKHLAVCQSHGIFFDTNRGTWRWQRPRLFCTTEDLFTQTLVVPYLIPMLENAGAVVYTARERDWQSHEVIIDNDHPQQQGVYIEKAKTRERTETWHTTSANGFAHIRETYIAGQNPFHDGTARYVPTVTNSGRASVAEWKPDIPADGRYAVYVSYQSLPTSVTDAHYTVYHRGGMTEFAVNQTMGGSTWVYLGTFDFAAGVHDDGKVTLSNESAYRGVVTADAVRFGGGMGNIARGLSDEGGRTSGMPRWAEAARYSAQWAGMPDSVYDYFEHEDDYKSDILSRPRVANELAGSSLYVPRQTGRGVPLELSLAFHSDAGFKADDSRVGSLSICTTHHDDGLTDAGISRYASRDLADMLLANLYTDLAHYRWPVRRIYNRNYGETRVPAMPGVILESLSHQNFADMQMGYDPQFKFDFCRSVYKTVVKYEAAMHQRAYVIQPLPVTDFSVTLDEECCDALLTWQPVIDVLEPTARPTHYVVYVRRDDESFDNGTVVRGTSCTVPLFPDHIYSFRVCALNAGGQSFPSETLSACVSSQNQGTVLIVNAFTRLSGPSSFNTATEQGFDLFRDPGVPYGAFAGFCGAQLVFTKSTMGSETSSGLGYSGSELEGQVVMGNTFDYPYLHGCGIKRAGCHSFTSCSVSAFLKANSGTQSSSPLRAARYAMLDVICGVQKGQDERLHAVLSHYTEAGGRLLVSGANVAQYGFDREGVLLHTRFAGTVNDSAAVTTIHGSGLQFGVQRRLNSQCYAVPSPDIVEPMSGAFAMLAYANGTSAAVAYDGRDHKTVTLGFPLESVADREQRDNLMSAIVRFLTADRTHAQ